MVNQCDLSTALQFRPTRNACGSVHADGGSSGHHSQISISLGGSGFHSHGGTPNSWLVYFTENPMKIDDDLGVTLFLAACDLKSPSTRAIGSLRSPRSP